jgi:hypothetical protein
VRQLQHLKTKNNDNNNKNNNNNDGTWKLQVIIYWLISHWTIKVETTKCKCE